MNAGSQDSQRYSTHNSHLPAANPTMAYMDSRAVLCWGTLLAAMATCGHSSSSINATDFAASCSTSIDCLNQRVEDSSGLLNVSRVCCNGFCVEDSSCRGGKLRNLNSTSLTNNTRTNANHNSTNDTVLIVLGNNTKTSGENLNSTTNSTDHNDLAICSTSEDCNSTLDIKYVCLSRQCAGIYDHAEERLEECSCEQRGSLHCVDGRCYNETLPNEAAFISTQKGGITPLQYMLLFGSMGAIIVMIILIYFVKTFTDKRRRRYLLKYGVWPETENKEQDSRQNEAETSQASTGNNKIPEIPIITIEMEKEPSTSSISVRDDKSRSEGKSEDGESSENIKSEKKGKVTISPDTKPSKGEDIPTRPIAVTVKPKENEKPIANSTHKPTINQKTETKESPTLKKDKEFKIPESPKTRFNVYGKGKDSPQKIMANGSPTLNRGKKGTPPMQLCEPENFSDYGM